jgi:DNA-binding NarL/FixJ family response regulator
MVERGAPLTVAIYDSQPLVRIGLRTVLDREPDVDVVSEAPGPIELGCNGSVLADVVVLSDWRPLLEAARRAGGAPVRVVLLAGDNIPHTQLLSLLRNGIRCVVYRHGSPHDVVPAVRAAARDAAFLTQPFADIVLPTAAELYAAPAGDRLAQLDALTPRERQVLGLVCQGLANQQIGERLRISTKTVKFHVSNVLVKLDKRTRGQLIASIADPAVGLARMSRAAVPDAGPRTGTARGGRPEVEYPGRSVDRRQHTGGSATLDVVSFVHRPASG